MSSSKTIKNNNQNKELIDLIIKEAYLSNLPESDKQAVRDNLSLQIDRRIGLIILDNLNKEGQDEYANLLESGPAPDPQKLQALLEKYIPDYSEKIKEGLNDFVKEAIAALSE